MKAILVTNSFITRVIIPDEASQDEIIRRTEHKFKQNMSRDFSQSFQEVKMDTEMPYDSVNDAVKPYLLAPHLSIVK